MEEPSGLLGLNWKSALIFPPRTQLFPQLHPAGLSCTVRSETDKNTAGASNVRWQVPESILYS